MEEQKKEEKTIEQLKEELLSCQKEKDEYLSGWQRQKADFLNYQKDIDAKIKESNSLANENLIYDFLPILDSFDLSIKFFEKKELSEEEAKMLKGVEMTRGQLGSVLKRWGLETIEALGQEFNPEIHEAIEGEDREYDAESKLVVIEEIMKGYRLNGKLLRPSGVKVGNKNNK